MKATALLLGFLVACGATATASTVVASAAVDTLFQTSAAAPLDNSFVVNVGWYNTGLYDVTNGEVINTNFVSVGSIAFPYAGNPAYNGYFSGNVAFTEGAGDFALAGDNVFFFVTNGVDQFALIETDDQFLGQTAVPNTTTISVEAASVPDYTFHSGILAGDNSTITLKNGLVPEPSAFMLGSLGLLGLLRRRRS